MQRWSGQSAGLVLVLSCSLALGCKERESPSGAPSVSATPRAPSSRCKDGGGTPRFDQALFVRQAFGYCIDPHGETRAYGSGAPAPLEEACEQLFGDCAAQVEGGLERITTLRYVEDRATGGSVDATLFRFARRAQAFGFFTRRVLGDADPLELRRVPLAAGAGAALGATVVDVWRGAYVLELRYVNEREPPERVAASAARILPELARTLGDRLVGEKAPLEEVALLPKQNLLPLGVRYENDRLLGVRATGPGAIGHYTEGSTRYRVVAALRDDEQGAVDLRETFARAGLFRPLKKEDAIEVRFPPVGEVPAQRWVFAQRGNALIGVGDERHGSTPPSDEPERELQSKLRTLKKMIVDNRLPPPKRKKTPAP